MALWMSSLEASRANRSVLPENARALAMIEICGLTPFASFERCSPNGVCLRMSQGWLLGDISGPSSAIWPIAGLLLSGECYRLPRLEHRISEIAFGSSDDNFRWATPTARDWRSGKASPKTHNRNSRPLSEQIGRQEDGGNLNADWVEWLMGWPIGASDLQPLAMDKFHSWLLLHGITLAAILKEILLLPEGSKISASFL